MNSDLIKYYNDRASEYERIYSKPERQNDLLRAEKLLQGIFRGKKVFEFACGTGYWTQKIAGTAECVYATDVNAAVIDIARSKSYPRNNVTCAVADLFELNTLLEFDHLFGRFIFSHILVQERDRFIQHLQRIRGSARTLVLMDNLYVEGSNHPVSETDHAGNTYQYRKLGDGTSHKVLKNFPLEKDFSAMADKHGLQLEFIQLEYFWITILEFPSTSL